MGQRNKRPRSPPPKRLRSPPPPSDCESPVGLRMPDDPFFGPPPGPDRSKSDQTDDAETSFESEEPKAEKVKESATSKNKLNSNKTSTKSITSESRTTVDINVKKKN